MVIFLLLLIAFTFGNSFEKLKEVLRNTETLKVVFVQKVIYDWYPKPDVSKGILYAKRGERIRLDYTYPDRITIISDRKKVYLIHYEEKKVYVEDMSRNTSPVINSLLFLSEPVEEVFTFVGKEKNEEEAIILRPKKKDENLKLVKVYLKNGNIEKIKTYDGKGTEVVIEFIEVKRNFKPSEELFKIKFPDGFRVFRYE
ncbi:outer membrane lipoprotein carrier protein LolA [Aquifex pyrophilus]